MGSQKQFLALSGSPHIPNFQENDGVGLPFARTQGM